MASKTVFTTGVREELYDCLWKIENFLMVQEDESLVAEQNLKFETHGQSVRTVWQVGLNVYYPGTIKTIGIYFKLVSLVGASNVKAKVSIDLKKLNGEAQWEACDKKSVSPGEEIRFEKVFQFNRSERRGLPWLDENGMITLGITVATRTVVDVKHTAGTSREMENFKKNAVSNLQVNHSNLLEDTTFSDVKLICSDGVELTAHSLILKAQCPIFESMLCPASNFSESTSGEIQVDDISSKIMALLLHYIYTGELKEGWNHPKNIVEFTYAAAKYQLTPILEMLDNVIGKGEDETCSLVMLSLANKLSLEKAESKLMKRIVNRTNNAKSALELLNIFDTDT